MLYLKSTTLSSVMDEMEMDIYDRRAKLSFRHNPNLLFGHVVRG